jgi:hypothetical protein
MSTEYKNYLGGEVYFVDRIPTTNRLSSAEASDLRFDSPGAIMLIADNPGNAGIFMNNLVDSGIEPFYFGPKSLKTNKLAASAGLASEGFMSWYYPEGTAEFRDNYESKYGYLTNPKAVQGYDAAIPVFQAITLKARQSERLKKKLHSVAFQEVSGQISFKDNGKRGVRYDVYEIKDGRYVKIDSR